VDWPPQPGNSATRAVAPSVDLVPEGKERPTPGVAALLSGVRADRSHSVLDLGAAAASGLRLYGRFARRVRFADILSGDTPKKGWHTLVSALPPQPESPYDLLFAWDILDRLFPDERPRLVERLAEVSAAEARLHVIVDAAENDLRQPLRYTLLGPDRMLCEPTGPPQPARGRILPAKLERILKPFHVIRGFTLQGGLREYVAVRQGH
jgi:hypothetical protein